MAILTAKNKDGEMVYYWQFRIDGKCYTGRCNNCTTKEQAKKYLLQEKKKYKAVHVTADTKMRTALIQEYYGGKKILLDEACNKYLLKPSKRTRSPKTEKGNRHCWNDFVAFLKAKYSQVKYMHQVTKEHANEYYNHIKTNGAFQKQITYKRKGREFTYDNPASELSARAINAYHKTCKAVFAHLAEDIGLTVNPFDFDMMEEQSSTKSRETFTDSEIELLVQNATDRILKPIVIVGLSAGLTLGDIALLRWENIVNDTNGVIIKKYRNKTGALLNVPLPPDAGARLAEFTRGKPDDYCFPELAEMYKKKSLWYSPPVQ